jgi:hypothetical protein
LQKADTETETGATAVRSRLFGGQPGRPVCAVEAQGVGLVAPARGNAEMPRKIQKKFQDLNSKT